MFHEIIRFDQFLLFSTDVALIIIWYVQINWDSWPSAKCKLGLYFSNNDKTLIRANDFSIVPSSSFLALPSLHPHLILVISILSTRTCYPAWLRLLLVTDRCSIKHVSFTEKINKCTYRKLHSESDIGGHRQSFQKIADTDMTQTNRGHACLLISIRNSLFES